MSQYVLLHHITGQEIFLAKQIMKYYHTELSDAHFTLSHLSTSGQVFTYWQASPGKFAEAFTTNSNLKVPNIIRLVATRLESCSAWKGNGVSGQ